MSTIDAEHFTQALQMLLDETFEHGYRSYLDRNTSLFETLAGISAAEASIPVGGKCATLAAQVKHVAFYLNDSVKAVRDPSDEPVDWGEIWRTVGAVTPDEWEAIKAELRASYNSILELIKDTPAWPSAGYIAGTIAIIAHSAYHLGEIRQALCTLKP